MPHLTYHVRHIVTIHRALAERLRSAFHTFEFAVTPARPHHEGVRSPTLGTIVMPSNSDRQEATSSYRLQVGRPD